MPREKIVAKYRGENGEHFMHIPARDLYESDWAALTDEQKAALAVDPPAGVKRLYELRHDAPDEAEQAAERIEQAPDPTPPMAEAALADVPPAAEEVPAPKGGKAR